MDTTYSNMAIGYKKNIAGKFMLVEGAKLKKYVEGEQYCVTRKIDGHLQCLFYKEGEVWMLNSQGRERASGLKCMEVFGKLAAHARLKSAVFAAELFMPREGGRPRCGDVSTALADKEQSDRLSLAVFDIIEIDGTPWQASHYCETYDKLTEILTISSDGGSGRKASPLCRPVEMRKATSKEEVQAIYEDWVEGEGAEGLVVHSESHIVWKVKPRHTIDTAIIGYTIGDRGVRDLMLAVRRGDGCFQMFAHASGGLSDDDRSSLADRLCSMHVESQYVLSDSRGIAYQMVRPEIVFEVSVIELVARGNDDKVRMNPLLIYDGQQGWLHHGMTPGVSALGLTFERERTDKTPSSTDIRLSQLTDLCPFEQQEGCMAKMESSQLLDRRIYKKVSGEKVMLHKFLIWKTNKEATGRYPAYVFYHTDYSSGRKEMIKRDMAYSCEEAQIRDIMEREITANIKKGWECLKC